MQKPLFTQLHAFYQTASSELFLICFLKVERLVYLLEQQRLKNFFYISRKQGIFSVETEDEIFLPDRHSITSLLLENTGVAKKLIMIFQPKISEDRVIL